LITITGYFLQPWTQFLLLKAVVAIKTWEQQGKARALLAVTSSSN